MKRVLFLLHGIGRMDRNWSANVVKAIRDLAGALENDPASGFAANALKDAVEETEFVELLYDDLFQRITRVIFERQSLFIEALREDRLGTIADLFTTDAGAPNTLRDNLVDILFYRAMKEHRHMVRKHVQLQMLMEIQERGTEDIQYSVMAHSLGTVVMHDTLQEMSTEPGSPFRLGSPFMINNLFMVANTSFMLQTDYDPRTSNVRPFIGQNDAGYVFRYWDFAHRFDPVAQLRGFAAGMRNLPQQRFTFVTVDHFKAANIHSYTHYLGDPRVHARVFEALYGRQIFPEAFVARLLAQPSEPGIPLIDRDALITRLAMLINGADPNDRSDPIIRIASILEELI
jgi:hypothetical protein